MDGNKQKEHYFEFNNTNLNNEMKEENTKLIGKNITEGIYRVEITGYGKKGSENFIEKYKPLNIQIRNIENEKNTFTLKYFIFFILILMITLLILFDTIKNNKLVIVHQRKYNYYTQLNDEEEEMMKI
jgi:hypothetical protein